VNEINYKYKIGHGIASNHHIIFKHAPYAIIKLAIYTEKYINHMLSLNYFI